MKPRILSYLTLLLTLLSGPASAASNGPAAAVNGRYVLKSEVEEHMRFSMMELLRRYPDPAERASEMNKLRGKMLDQLIDQELVLKEFEPFAASADSRVEAHADEVIKRQFVDGMCQGDWKKFYRELNASGVSLKKFKEQHKNNIIMEMMRGQFAKIDTPYVTEEEKAAWLRKNSHLFRVGGKLKLWSITIAGIADGKTPAQQQALAREVRTSLVNGADFASLARTHSTDSRSEAGGSRGWVGPKDLDEAFWPIVSKLEAGKISEIVPFGGSFYIFWVEAKEAGKMRPQAEIDAEVEKRVLLEKRMKASEEWLKKLRKKATIKKFQ